MKTTRNTSYPLRLRQELRFQAELAARENRRSLNAEIGVLIEDGLKWREMQRRATA